MADDRVYFDLLPGDMEAGWELYRPLRIALMGREGAWTAYTEPPEVGTLVAAGFGETPDEAIRQMRAKLADLAMHWPGGWPGLYLR